MLIVVLTRFNLLILHSHDKDGKVSSGSIGASQVQRQWIGLSLTGDQATLERLPDSPHQGAAGYLQAMDLEVSFLKRGVDVAEVYSADEMAKNFVTAFDGTMMTTDQLIVFEYHGQNLKGLVRSVNHLQVPGYPPSIMKRSGVVTRETDVTILKSADSPIKIKSSGRKSVLCTNLKW